MRQLRLTCPACRNRFAHTPSADEARELFRTLYLDVTCLCGHRFRVSLCRGEPLETSTGSAPAPAAQADVAAPAVEMPPFPNCPAATGTPPPPGPAEEPPPFERLPEGGTFRMGTGKGMGSRILDRFSRLPVWQQVVSLVALFAVALGILAWPDGAPPRATASEPGTKPAPSVPARPDGR